MSFANGLIKIPTPSLKGAEETPVYDIFRTVTPDEFFDADPQWFDDNDSYGLIIYLFKGNREWVKTSVSKTPFAFLKKNILLEAANGYLEGALIIRGTSDFPLTDKEVKTLSGLIINKLRSTKVSAFSSYSTIGELNDELELVLNNAVTDFTTIVSTHNWVDIDLTETVVEKIETEPGEVSSGNETVTINGLTLNVVTRLINDNDPTEGVGFVSIRVTDPDGKNLLYASSGALKNDTESNN